MSKKDKWKLEINLSLERNRDIITVKIGDSYWDIHTGVPASYIRKDDVIIARKTHEIKETFDTAFKVLLEEIDTNTVLFKETLRRLVAGNKQPLKEVWNDVKKDWIDTRLKEDDKTK